jgi:hypothetical protein
LGGREQFSQAFSGEVYEFYSVSPEYFGYALAHGKLFRGGGLAYTVNSVLTDVFVLKINSDID